MYLHDVFPLICRGILVLGEGDSCGVRVGETLDEHDGVVLVHDDENGADRTVRVGGKVEDVAPMI